MAEAWLEWLRARHIELENLPDSAEKAARLAENEFTQLKIEHLLDFMLKRGSNAPQRTSGGPRK
jgi:hypothetical protein